MIIPTSQKIHISKTDAIEMRHLRKIARKIKWNRIQNDTICEITKQERVTIKIGTRQVNWLDHITRMKPNRMTENIFEAW